MTNSRQSWDEYFMKIANEVSTRATCDRKHVGAVLVLDHRIISTGYNGSIPGAAHCDDVGHDIYEGHCVRTVHAEANAIAQAARAGVRTIGAICYVNTYPCWQCYKLLALAGIRHIIYDKEYRPDPRVEEASCSALASQGYSHTPPVTLLGDKAAEGRRVWDLSK